MTQLSQLSEAEIEERFYIVGQRPIQFLLAGFAEHGETFAVQFDNGQQHFLSPLLAAPTDSGQLLFDCSGSPELNRRFLQSAHNVFVGRPGGIHVQFSTGPALEVMYARALAFSVQLPKKIMRLQRREYFRIDTPRNRQPLFYVRLPDGTLLHAQPHDISCGGIGLNCPFPPADLGPGLPVGSCRLVLPEDGRDIFVQAAVRHITEQQARSGQTQWRIGLEFRDLEHIGQNRIQRYIARVEHERRELS